MTARFEPTGRPGDFGDLGPWTTERTEYTSVTDTPVHCFPVILSGEVIGYVWASATDDAAGFRARPGTGGTGWDAGGPWRGRFKRARDKGMAPLDAVREWVGAPEHPVGGRITVDAPEHVVTGSQAVYALIDRLHGKR